jgi:hypothetical protein
MEKLGEQFPVLGLGLAVPGDKVTLPDMLRANTSFSAGARALSAKRRRQAWQHWPERGDCVIDIGDSFEEAHQILSVLSSRIGLDADLERGISCNTRHRV